ncbi:MAG: DsbA family protein [Crocinitomicaceae bacterium]
MNFDWIKEDGDALIYIGDTMCSWCYGFSKNLETFLNAHSDLNVRLVQGGLRPNNTEKAIDMADFLKKHWIEITERTGLPFSFDILSDPNFVYDTEPASRAVVVARMIDPTIEYEFFKAVQIAFYRDNEDTGKLETYLKIAETLNIDTNEYSKLFNSEEARYNTKADFQLSAEMGIKGFPSLVIKKGDEFTMLANGFRELEDLELVYQKIIG